MIPGFVMLIPQFVQITNLGLFNSYWGLILPPAAYQVAMGTFLTRSSMEAISKSLFEAAEIEGAGDMDILLKVVLPVQTDTVHRDHHDWAECMEQLYPASGRQLRRSDTADCGGADQADSIGIGRKRVLFAGYIIASLPLVILFCFASKYFVAGITQERLRDKWRNKKLEFHAAAAAEESNRRKRKQ